MKGKWRLFWLTGLVLLWLLCSGTAWAGSLSDRLAAFPNWQGKPPAPVAQGDLIYPDWFAGRWQVTTTLTEMVAPFAPDLITPGFESNRQFINKPILFPVRFVKEKQRLLSWGKPGIISDRAFNGMSLAKAYLGDRPVLAVKVDPTNPNRQITLLRNERELVSTVTARATESAEPFEFITSEVFQQEFRSVSQLYFNEVENTTAYQRPAIDKPAIVADQVTAIYLSPQDPDYFKTLENPLGEPRPVALYRYRLEFVKRLD
ncbi:MAG: hypothetical protein HC781_06330 [Leptolyngbyaceae cyanobacterium CSU_1_4]|nr:hypothetical protein [Leptolyngbyaceae cyanobacterium CSU_1_4]